MTDKIMTIWIKIRECICHKYSLVGFLVSPNITILKEDLEKKTDANEESVARLIEKLFLDNYVIGREISEEISDLIHTFRKDYGDYTLHMNKFSRQDMCIIAKRPTQAVHFWHKTYSLGPTNILGKLACIVTSKILDVVTSERHWKKVKQVKSGKRATIGTLECKKHDLCLSVNMQIRARLP